MNFLQFAVWGSYLTSMGTYLAGAGMASNIGLFYAMQGIVSLFMPALIGIIADRWIEAQRLLGICHGLAALFMFGAGYYAMTAGDAVAFAPPLYALCPERGILHAYHSVGKFGGVQRPRKE